MALQKREKKKEGIKILAYGDAGSGKSPFGLSFPNQLLFDADSSTAFYEGNNVLMESTALSFPEMLADFDKVDRDKQLLSEIETISIDSMTRYTEKQAHAALKVAENRARANGRPVEGETISPKERGVMQLNYDRVFARLIGYAKLGKNLVIIAEKKDKTENKIDGSGNSTYVKAGEVPSLPKDSDYDFDVIVRTYLKDGKPFGKIEKDRTGSYKVGDEIEKPNYTHWEEAIKKAQAGKQREQDEIKTFDEVLEADVRSFDSEGAKVKDMHEKIRDILTGIEDDEYKKGTVYPEIKKVLGYTNFTNCDNTQKLEQVLEVVSKLKK